MKTKILFLAMLIACVSVLSAQATASDNYFENARAGECTACTTLSTMYCGSLGNTCGLNQTEKACKDAGACTGCTNGGSSYATSTSTTNPDSGTEPDGTIDCGNQKNNGVCYWKLWVVCICKDGSDSGSPGNCGERTKYKSCDPTP